MATMHFSISGEFVTQHARDRIFDRGWEDAVRFLNDYIIDLGLDRSVAILRGEKRLSGINDLNLVKEKSARKAKLIARTNYTFAGTVFDGTHYWRPYATVDNWGPNDLYNAREGENQYAGLTPSIFSRSKDTSIRNVHYMNDKRHDRAIFLKMKSSDGCNDTVAVLWERVNSVPVWYHAYNTMQWQIAFDEYLVIGRKMLSSRGHSQWYPPEPKDKTAEKQVNPVIAKALMDIEEKRRSYPPLGEPDKSLNGNAGWIIADGKFYDCPYSGHINLADTLMYHFRGVESPNPERDAELLGWIKVAHTLENDKPDHYLLLHEGKNKLTLEQVKTLVKWCEIHNTELPYWFDEKNPNAD